MYEVNESPLWLQLRPYQKEGVIKLLRPLCKCEFDDMGLGKTLQTLLALETQLRQSYGPDISDKRILILCPTKALYVWRNEIQKWLRQNAVIYSGTIAKRRKIEYSAGYIVSTYAMAADLGTNFDGVIADEIHAAGLLNHKTQTYSFMSDLLKGKRHFYLLTGTPIRQGVVDLYAPLHLIDPVKFPNYWAFVNKHCNTITGPFGKSIERNPKDIVGFRSMLDNYMVRRIKSEVLLDLPGKQRIPIPVDMTPLQKRAHNEILESFIFHNEEDDGLVLAQNKMNAIMRCRQLLVTPRLLGFDEDGAALDYLKEAGKELLECNRPFVVFTPFRDAVDIIAEVVDEICKGINIYILKGGMKAEVFGDTWMNFLHDPSSLKVMVATVQSGASFDATCAADCFFLGYEWDFNHNSQAEDRLCRSGQNNFVNCNYVLHEGTADEMVKEKLNSKSDASNWIIGTQDQYQAMLARYQNREVEK